MEQDLKEKIIELLKSERWFVLSARTTDLEVEVADLLNKILDNTIEKIKLL